MTVPSPQHLYRQALQYLQQGQWARARENLTLAAGNGFAPAIKELGILELHGIGGPADAISAVNRFQQSSLEPESCFELSRCLYFGYGIQRDTSAALHWLKRAAQANYPEALRVLAMLAQWHDGQESSEPRIANAQGPAAETLMCAAARAGDAFARFLHSQQALRAQESMHTGEKTLAAIENVRWPQHLPRDGQHLNEKPDITLFDGALTDWQCDYIRFRGAPHLRPSMVLDPVTGQRIKDPVRNSDSAAFDWFLEDIVINAIMHSVTALTGIDAERSEPLHLLRYGVGQEYKPHYDFVGGLENTGQFAEQQRTDTLCLYLNDVPVGGQTAFPRLGLSVPARRGQVVHFQNVDANGSPFVDSLHCGLPVRQGEKWLATLWIRKHNTNRGMDYE